MYPGKNRLLSVFHATFASRRTLHPYFVSRYVRRRREWDQRAKILWLCHLSFTDGIRRGGNMRIEGDHAPWAYTLTGRIPGLWSRVEIEKYPEESVHSATVCGGRASSSSLAYPTTRNFLFKARRRARTANRVYIVSGNFQFPYTRTLRAGRSNAIKSRALFILTDELRPIRAKIQDRVPSSGSSIIHVEFARLLASSS